MRLAPGIRIIDQPLAAADSLPPMDVAVFVGFAERGPLHPWRWQPRGRPFAGGSG